MKLNKILWLGSILLVGAALVLSGCSKKENPYSPDSGYAAGVVGGNLVPVSAITISPALGSAMTDVDPGLAGCQGQILIDFNVEMSPGTVNLTNIEVAGYTSGGVITNATIVYYPGIKRAVIGGTFATPQWYKITFKRGLVSNVGQPIDGNGNGHFDGSPYDDYVQYFRTGAPTEPTPDIIHPQITAVGPGPSGYVNSGTIAIFVGFASGDFDSMTVKNNVFLTDSAGNTVPIKSAGVAGGTMFFEGNTANDTLLYNTRYNIRIVANNITDSFSFYGAGTENKCVYWDYGYIANLPDIAWYFRRMPPTGGDIDPLHFSSCLFTTDYAYITMDDSLDYSTINANNVKLYHMDAGQIDGMLNATVFYQPNDPSLRRFRVSMENAISGETYRIWISRNVRDNAGFYLDGNNNGVGGEIGNPLFAQPSDDYKYDFTF